MLWVAELRISPRTAAKVRALHGVEPDEVRDAVVCVPRLWFVEHTHHGRGYRVLVKTRIREWPTVVVLYPDARNPLGDVWHLGSAYRVPG